MGMSGWGFWLGMLSLLILIYIYIYICVEHECLGQHFIMTEFTCQKIAVSSFPFLSISIF